MTDLKALLLDDLPPEALIVPDVGQIWIKDNNGQQCKVLGITKSYVMILLDVSFKYASGRYGARCYNELSINSFINNYTFKEG